MSILIHYIKLLFVYIFKKARIFFISQFVDFFSDLGSGGGGQKKAEYDQLTGHFQWFFLISPQTVKLISKVNQQTVLNYYIFHHFPKNLDRTITFNSVTLKTTQTEPQKCIFFSTKQIIFKVGG